MDLEGKNKEEIMDELKKLKIIPDNLNQFFDHSGDLSKDRAIELLVKFMTGSWTKLEPKDLELTVLQGGYVNRIFICENKAATGNEPRKVLLRLYGGKIMDQDHPFRNGTLMDEVMVFYAMSDKGYGPKLYGVFPEGRIEEFIPGHLMNNDDFLNPVTIGAFAKKLALFHNVDVPLKKRPVDVMAKIEKLLPLTEDFAKEVAPKPLPFDFPGALKYLKEVRPKIKSRVALVHGDMNRANCLMRDDRDDPVDKVVLLDYEFAAYGWRGQDIGLHFAQRHMDVNNVAGQFKSGLEYPTREEQLQFVRSYKEQIKASKFYQLEEGKGEVDNDEMMLMDAEYFALIFTVFMQVVTLQDRKKGGGLCHLFNVKEADHMYGLMYGMQMGFAAAKARYEGNYAELLK